MSHDSASHDINDLIDLIASQVTEGKRVFLSNRVIVDEVEFMQLLEELREAVPIEIKRARRVLQDRQQIILDAQKEAENIIAKARERAEYLVSQQGITAEARYRSEDMLRQSRDGARRSMGEVDSYAQRVLDQVERVMREHLAEIERAKQSLPSSHAERLSAR